VYGHYGRVGQVFRRPAADFSIVPGFPEKTRIVVIRLRRRTEKRSIVFLQSFRTGRARGYFVSRRRRRRAAPEFPFRIPSSRRGRFFKRKYSISDVNYFFYIVRESNAGKN